MNSKLLQFRIVLSVITGFAFVFLAALIAALLANELPWIGITAMFLMFPGVLWFHTGSIGLGLFVDALIYSALAFPFIWASTRNLDLSRFARLLRSYALVTVGIVLAGGVFATGVHWILSAPSNESMRKQFNRHRDAFETLVSVTENESVNKHISEREYGKLLQQADLSSPPAKDLQGNLYFTVHVEGFFMSGSSKGFVYCPNSTEHASMLLPCAQQRDAGEGVGAKYQKLSDHWFIYSEWN